MQIDYYIFVRVLSYEYTLGAAGNRVAVREQGGRYVTYSYDDNYRLTTETVGGDPTGYHGITSYSYDAVGNRLSKTNSISTTGGNQSFVYDNNDRITTNGTTNGSYDNNGNTTWENYKVYAYDYENRLVAFQGTVARFTYDGDGNLVGKRRQVGGATPDVVTSYLVDTNNPTGYSQIVEELQNGAVTKQFTYGNDLISQRIISNNQISFYQYDGHGSVRRLINHAGAVTDTYDYDAFGLLIRATGLTDNDYRYAGERYDEQLQFYHLRARHLNPSTGRFLSMDSFEGINNEPVSLHKYLYAGSNPVDRIDPSGNSFIGEIGALVTRGVLATQAFLLNTTSYVVFNMVQLFGWIEIGLVSLQFLTAAAQFTINRESNLLIGRKIGDDGESEVRRFLTEKGFDVKLSIQSNINQGVDVIAKDSRDDWNYFEVKTTIKDTPVNEPIKLQEPQRDMRNFLRTRLQSAIDGKGNYAHLSKEARQNAVEALRSFEADVASGRNVKAYVAEVRLPLYYMTRLPRIPFSITFRRWK